MMPIKKRKGSLGAEEKKEEGEEPVQQPPSAKRRKKSVIQYDPVSVSCASSHTQIVCC